MGRIGAFLCWKNSNKAARIDRAKIPKKYLLPNMAVKPVFTRQQGQRQEKAQIEQSKSAFSI